MDRGISTPKGLLPVVSDADLINRVIVFGASLSADDKRLIDSISV